MQHINKSIIGLILMFQPPVTQASSGGPYFEIMMLESCAILSDEYRLKSQSIMSRWKESAPELFDIISKSDLITPEHREIIEKLSAQQMKDAKENCDEMFANMETKLQPLDARFSSPEKTWGLFLQSLKSADKETAAKCLSGRARQNLTSFFASRNNTQLREMGESFTGFHPMGHGEEFQDAMVTRSNGKAGVVLFTNQGGNWKIEDM